MSGETNAIFKKSSLPTSFYYDPPPPTKEILPDYCSPLLLRSPSVLWSLRYNERNSVKLWNIFYSFTKTKMSQSSFFENFIRSQKLFAYCCALNCKAVKFHLNEGNEKVKWKPISSFNFVNEFHIPSFHPLPPTPPIPSPLYFGRPNLISIM